MNRVQRKWMMSWQRMRDQQIRPRKIAEMRLNEKPKVVQVGYDFVLICCGAARYWIVN